MPPSYRPPLPGAPIKRSRRLPTVSAPLGKTPFASNPAPLRWNWCSTAKLPHAVVIALVHDAVAVFDRRCSCSSIKRNRPVRRRGATPGRAHRRHFCCQGPGDTSRKTHARPWNPPAVGVQLRRQSSHPRFCLQMSCSPVEQTVTPQRQAPTGLDSALPPSAEHRSAFRPEGVTRLGTLCRPGEESEHRVPLPFGPPCCRRAVERAVAAD